MPSGLLCLLHVDSTSCHNDPSIQNLWILDSLQEENGFTIRYYSLMHYRNELLACKASLLYKIDLMKSANLATKNVEDDGIIITSGCTLCLCFHITSLYTSITYDPRSYVIVYSAQRSQNPQCLGKSLEELSSNP